MTSVVNLMLTTDDLIKKLQIVRYIFVVTYHYRGNVSFNPYNALNEMSGKIIWP